MSGWNVRLNRDRFSESRTNLLTESKWSVEMDTILSAHYLCSPGKIKPPTDVNVLRAQPLSFQMNRLKPWPIERHPSSSVVRARHRSSSSASSGRHRLRLVGARGHVTAAATDALGHVTGSRMAGGLERADVASLSATCAPGPFGASDAAQQPAANMAHRIRIRREKATSCGAWWGGAAPVTNPTINTCLTDCNVQHRLTVSQSFPSLPK